MNIYKHERDGTPKRLDGRTVYTVQTPELTGGKYSSVLVTVYDPGAKAKPAHAHDDGEETIYVASGEGKAKVGEEVFRLETGSLLLFPQGVPHMCWNTGTVPLKLICFYAPQQSALDYTYYEDFDFTEEEAK
ncbi:MAG: cupin domain-containing protein [Clostridiales bacterium]|nr:cupin domain-containing protein [Clostridiales bacterium]